MYYRIRIQGHLDPCWQDRFGGLHIFYAEPKKLLHAFGKALARFTQQAGNEPDPAKWETEVAIRMADQS